MTPTTPQPLKEPRPVKWELRAYDHATGQGGECIEERTQRDGSKLFSICNGHGDVLNWSNEWEWEPQPSSRDEAFMKRTRYTSVDSAFAHFVAAFRALTEEGK